MKTATKKTRQVGTNPDKTKGDEIKRDKAKHDETKRDEKCQKETTNQIAYMSHVTKSRHLIGQLTKIQEEEQQQQSLSKDRIACLLAVKKNQRPRQNLLWLNHPKR